ncbi:MAG: replication-associated recombination protein A [Eubacteriales bacterium]|nr:replication-associated recombination protein A [Eubacteriales bacterium]
MTDFDQQTFWSTMDGHPTQAPLADRMRPRTLDEFIGQQKLVGEGRLLRRAIMADRLQSSIFWGPPGCGKTTLAGIVANLTGSAFEKLNAVTSGVADVRKVLKEAQERRTRYGKATYLLLDECHRWSKAQSDSILPAIESGLIRFIGSTTENPMASMTPAIVSRCRVFAFEPLSISDVETALKRALADPERGYGRYAVTCEDGALRYIARVAGGDVRVALSALELAFLTTPETTDESHPAPYRYLSLSTAQESVQKPMLKLDEDLYYDMLSAFIKSMRGSDADAALLWFARLLYAGVDPKLIVRRIIVHASEDVGLADPVAMLQAHAAANARETVGMPEARIPIAQAIIAICMAEKSNSVVNAIDAAMADAEKGDFSAVPEYLRDQSYSIPHKDTGGYLYPHDYPDHFVKQTYLPKGYENRVYYQPGELGNEAKLKARLARRFGRAKEP